MKKAVDLALEAAREGPVYALGPLAHNESLLKKLGDLGVIFVNHISEVPEGETVLIRSQIGRASCRGSV